MFNRLLELLFINKKSNSITKEQESILINDIEIINLKRMKLFLSVLLIIEILFIVFSDIPNLTHIYVNEIWIDKRYIIIHLSLAIVSFIGIILINSLLENGKGNSHKTIRLVSTGLTITSLILISVIDGLDQANLRHSSSVFIATMLICSAALIIEFPASFFVFSIPFITYAINLFVFQKNPDLIYSNLINGLIYLFTIIIISKNMYEHQYDQLYKKMELENINQQLNYISNHDQLTGLLNRRNFETKARQKLEGYGQSNQELALVLIDIDHFKQINDQFGHFIGDIVLKEVSNILLSNLEDTDLVARWGGEEFILLISPSSTLEAYELSNRIRNEIEKKIILMDKFKINITASFGIAKLTGNFTNSFDTSFKIADESLYHAKNSGRNKVILGYE
jgi:diguanylate cyclase